MAQQGSFSANAVGRYATALFDLAQEVSALDAVNNDLARFEGIIKNTPDFERFVKSPVFTVDEQSRAIHAILEHAGFTGLTSKFIQLVTSKKRLFLIVPIIACYRTLVAQAKGIVKAEVTLAEKPSLKMIDNIKSSLRDMAGGDVDIDLSIDPSLIGGIVVKIGSRMVDASVRTKLNSLHQLLKEVG